MHGRRMSRRLALFACCAVALAGCHERTPAEPQPSGPVRVSAPPSMAALPGCPAIGTALGDLVTGLTPLDDTDSRYDAPSAYGVSCTWVAPSPDAAEGDPPSGKAGAFGVMLIVDRAPLSADELQQSGMLVASEAASRIGAVVVHPDGALDPAAALGPEGVQVVAGPVTVTLAATPALAGHPIAGRETIRNAEAVDGAVAIHRLMR